MKNLKFLIFILLPFLSFAQSNYEEGYYINSSGVKQLGLIENENWRSSPEQIKFKNSEDDSVKLLGLNDVVEFGVPKKFKFIKRNVQVDYSPEAITRLSRSKDPDYKRANVFLKILEEGAVNLYIYEGQGVTSFYFSKVDKVILSSIHDRDVVGGEIIPLVYKKYYDSNNVIRENNAYKQLLNKYLKSCNTIENKDFINLKYTENSLSSFISKFNQCSNSENLSYKLTKRKAVFSFNARAGLLFSDTKIETPARTFNVEQYSSIKYGIEGELLLPIGNYNFSAFVGYERKESISKTIPIIYKIPSESFTDRDTDFIYKSSEMLIGFRYYNNINEDFRISLGSGLIFDSRSELLLDFDNSTDIISDRFGTNLMFSVGLYYKRFGLHGVIQVGKDYFSDTIAFESKVNEFNLMLSYSIFSTKK